MFKVFIVLNPEHLQTLKQTLMFAEKIDQEAHLIYEHCQQASTFHSEKDNESVWIHPYYGIME